MENAMSRRKGKKLIIFIGIAIFIILLIFLKMKYGIYGKMILIIYLIKVKKKF